MKKLVSAIPLLFAAAALAAVPDFTTFIAHRGESVDAPENTLPAYKTAVERGFGFECDIYLSKDGRVFTFHDTDLKRTTAGANTKKCSDTTWDEIKALDVGSWGKWKGSHFAGTRPALLEEVLELARDGRKIYVEVKTGPEIVPYIKEIFAAQKNATPENTLFISFNDASCAALKKAMPEYKVYWLVSPKKDAPWTNANAIVEKLESIGADGVDAKFNQEIVTAGYIKTVRDAGFEFHVWTVDDLADSILAFSRGAQTVTTNCAKKQLDAWILAKQLMRLSD